MGKICLCYFSGTGMTKYVAYKLMDRFNEQGMAVDSFAIESYSYEDVDISSYDLFIIAYPVHAFNAPKKIIDFARQLPKQKQVDTAILCVAGADNKCNYAASDLLMRILNKKGCRVFYSRLFEMPANFMIKYDDDKVEEIIKRAGEDVPAAARDIHMRTLSIMKGSATTKLLAFFGRCEWFGARFMGLFYYTKKSCNGCGQCIDNCPNQNIISKKGYVKFKLQCGLCMRCIYACPSRAISVHRPLKFILLDEWYDSELFRGI